MIAIRGATTVSVDKKEEVLFETKVLLEKIINKNNLKIEDIISITFSATKDIVSVYPAVAAREISITSASLMCLQEMYVEGSLEKCIRISLMANSNLNQSDAKHIYLKNAASLRPDLSEEK